MIFFPALVDAIALVVRVAAAAAFFFSFRSMVKEGGTNERTTNESTTNERTTNESTTNGDMRVRWMMRRGRGSLMEIAIFDQSFHFLFIQR